MMDWIGKGRKDKKNAILIGFDYQMTNIVSA